jgi:hypothetical protein
MENLDVLALIEVGEAFDSRVLLFFQYMVINISCDLSTGMSSNKRNGFDIYAITN